jgi:CheY-like chemotaxis protein
MIIRDKIAHILIVDDDPISVMIAETLLQKHFHVRSVSSGREALNAMEESHYDIVLMDINLGDETMNGIQTMKLIRKNDLHAYTKIFAVTAYVDDKDWFLDQGFDDLYTKPIIKEEMVEVINQAFFRHPRRAA